MKLASIVPMKNVERTFDGDYAMMLTHLAKYYPKRKDLPYASRQCYRILDNSLIELGGAVDMEQLIEAAEMCEADEIILPDVFKDATATLKSVMQDSLWEANMEVLDPENSGIDIFDKTWKIYSRNPVLPAQKIGERAVVQDSLITEGCKIYGNVKHSVLSAGVVVEEGATVEDAVLMDGVVVKAGAVVKRCILAEDVVVGAGAKVGGEGAIAHVGTGLTIGAGATVKEGAKVFESVKEGVEVC